MHSVFAGREGWGLSPSGWFGVESGLQGGERERAEGVLIVPDWPGSSFLAVLESRVKEGTVVLMEKCRPVLICPREIDSNTFRGVPKFKMCIYRFNF